MTQVLQLLAVVAVGFGLACYGVIKGSKERNAERRSTVADPRQQALFPTPEKQEHPPELATR